LDRPPLRLPTGDRTASTITASATAFSLTVECITNYYFARWKTPGRGQHVALRAFRSVAADRPPARRHGALRRRGRSRPALRMESTWICSALEVRRTLPMRQRAI